MIVNGVVLLLVFGVTTSYAFQSSKISEFYRFRRQAPDAEKVGCRLPPPQQNGKFSHSKRRCPPDNDHPLCQMTPGNLVPHNWPLFHSCDPGFALNTTKTVSVCLDGRWKPALPGCIRLCPPLTSATTVRLKCVLGDQVVSCDHARPGTVAKAECPRYHRSSLEMSCQDGGSWADSRSDHMKTQVFPGSGNETVFHCVPDAHCVNNYKPEDFRVGLGKINSTFYKVESSSVILEVEKAVIHELYQSTIFVMDIAVLRLLLEAQVSSSIMPVCMDWSHIYTPESNTTLTVTGWNRTEDRKYNEKITPGKVRYVANRDCLKTISEDSKYLLPPEKSCAEDIDGHLYSGISGTATTIQMDGRHFLIGFLASKLTNNGRTLMMIVDVTTQSISQWIEKNLKTGPDCPDGQWDPTLPGCIRLCPPLNSTSVGVKCALGDQEVSCDHAKPGTVAKAECPRYHRSSLEMRCQDDGSWADSRSDHTLTQMFPQSPGGNQTVFRCVPECGISSKAEVNPSSLATEVSSSSEYPWVAGIFGKQEGEYRLLCIGTLISTFHVLTAAHCVHGRKPEELRVGLGKVNSNFYKVESSSVIFEVEEAVIHESYQSSIYAKDIAVLRLLLQAQVSSSIMPVCMDWSHIYTPESNITLTVTGWSRTKDRGWTENVTPGLVRYVTNEDCLKTLSGQFRRFLTPEKSCAEDVDGNIYNGISGTPSTLQEKGRHFLIGYLASKITNNDRPLMMVVDTTYQFIYQWLEKNLKQNSTEITLN